eukprot:9469050-Pyramimonas_sp.AAC.2
MLANTVGCFHRTAGLQRFRVCRTLPRKPYAGPTTRGRYAYASTSCGTCIVFSTWLYIRD